MSQLRILGPVGNVWVNAALIVGELVGLSVQHVVVEHKESVSKEFVKRYPLGVVPILLTEDGETILTPVAILKYLARSGKLLLGSSLLEETKVDQFIDIVVTLNRAYEDVTSNAYGFKEYDENAVKNAKRLLEKNLKFLSDALKIDVYLVGQKLSLADVALVSVLHRISKLTLDAKFTSEYSHTFRHLKYFSSILTFQKYLIRVQTITADWECPKKIGIIQIQDQYFFIFYYYVNNVSNMLTLNSSFIEKLKEEEKSVQVEKSAQVEQSAQVKKSAHVEKSAHVQKPVHDEKSAHVEKSTHVQKSAHVEKPAQVEKTKVSKQITH